MIVAVLHTSPLCMVHFNIQITSDIQMEFIEQKKQRKRASSAKNSQRRSSGPLTRQTEKVDLIQNLYEGVLSSKRDRDSKAIQRLLQGFNDEKDVFNSTSKRYKETEVLYEENITLKKEVNNLKREVQLQKGKTEVFRRRNSEYTKKLSIEHQKEMYWGSSSNSNLVMGIKNQYEIMKQKYNQKCRECQSIAKEFIFCQSKEDSAFIDVLIEENQKLKRNLDEARQELKILHHGTITSSVEQSLDGHKRWKFELQQTNQNLQSELQYKNIENEAYSQKIAQMNKKISFLDKLLIEKDNAEHASRKKLKKVEKEKQDLSDAFAAYKEEKESKVQILEEKLKQAKESAQKQAEREMSLFKKELDEKNSHIIKFQKQIAYLTTLLSYWKPLDELNQLVVTNMLSNGSEEDHNFILEYSKSIGGSIMKFNNSRHQNQIHVQEDDAKSITQSIINRSRRNSIGGSRRGSIEVTKHPQMRNVSDLMTKSIDLPKQVEKQKRARITANQRYNQDSVKCRKIHHEEITDICETLKYRLIGLNISIEDVRTFFDFQPDQNDILMTEEEKAWKREYINMQETKEILGNRYLDLNEADAELLSRYLIEDSQTDYVYRDLANENLRTVIKSILRNIIGEYQVQSNIQEIKKKAESLMERYETNLQSALRTTAPKGLISKKKLLELFKGLGIELSEDVQDYYLGKLVVQSENLSTLQYQFLFGK